MKSLVRETIQRQLRGYADWVAMPLGASSSLARVFDILTERSLDRAGPPYDGLSSINASGLPFQWSACFGPDTQGVRFLCESGTPGSSSRERYLESIELLGRCCTELGVPDPSWLHESVIPILVPGEREWPRHWRSAVWFGVGGSGSRVLLKPYFNLNRDAPSERWKRIGRLLSALGYEDDLARLCAWSSTVSPGSWPVGLAVDIVSDAKPGRVKAYFRAEPATEEWLERWYGAVHRETSPSLVRSALDCFPFSDGAAYPPGAFIVSLEFYGDGRPPTLKTDLGVTSWISSSREIQAGVRKLIAEATGRSSDCVDAFLGAVSVDASAKAANAFRFVGLGLEPDGEAHVNVYVEPQLALPDSRRSESRSLAVDHCSAARGDAIERGLEFLMCAQRGGFWKDYRLPVGEADEWVTAHTLLRLSAIDRSLRSRRLQICVDQALDWLERARRPGGGWGYNASCDHDADSTALAVLALRSFDRPCPADAMTILERCVAPDGGVSTYPPFDPLLGSWARPCADVAGVTWAALAPEGSDTRRLVAWYLDRELSSGDPPHSFWWVSRLYAAVLGLEFASPALSMGARTSLACNLSSARSVGAFETSLRIIGLTRLGLKRKAEEVLSQLMPIQRGDGSFPPSAWLRLTDREIERPWERIRAGRVFVDVGAVMTTATTLAAISAVSTH